MTNREGEHQRAAYQMHTGYLPAGGVRHPEPRLARRQRDRRRATSTCRTSSPSAAASARIGSGFLGMAYAPFVVANPSQMPGNVELPGGVTDDALRPPRSTC